MIGLEISTETVMEVEQSRAVNPAMTFDEVSMERSKNFVKALQVLHPLSLSLRVRSEFLLSIWSILLCLAFFMVRFFV